MAHADESHNYKGGSGIRLAHSGMKMVSLSIYSMEFGHKWIFTAWFIKNLEILPG